jgi:hypothetical protein
MLLDFGTIQIRTNQKLGEAWRRAQPDAQVNI